MEQLGWIDSRNLQIDYRWGEGNADNIRKYAAELVALAPDVILANSAAVVGPLPQTTKSVPIVFVLVTDPAGADFVDGLARPGGNARGFTAIESGFGGKGLELLKEIAPGTTRAAVVRDPVTSVGIGLFGAIQNAALLYQRASQARCPLSGVKRILVGLIEMSAFDPKRT